MKTNKEWISISDMMSGLMLIFMFISIVYILEAQTEKEAISKIAKTYDKLQKELYQDLLKEFEKDLKKWNAEILKNNTIRFKEPNVLFKVGESKIKDKFKTILNDFFPRYIKILSSEKYNVDIEEIRIEGHTSSIWNGTNDKKDRYLKNAKLSQKRAFEVLDYCINLNAINNNLDWLIKVFRANGLSFAKLIYIDNLENKGLSRRVEFRVITKSNEKIEKILEVSN